MTSVIQVELPADLTVPIAYGMTVLIGTGAQAILPEYGFERAGAVAADQL